MKTQISDILIGERIRKDSGDINLFAEDIRQNGLINPVSVMRTKDGDLKLLAGFRRIKAAELLGWNEIDINVLSPADAEAALMVEISENEQRKPFTIKEIDGYGKLLEDIERAKAKERMLSGKKDGASDPVPERAQGQGGRTRDIVAAKLGIGKTNYDCIKYIAEHAPSEIIDAIDRGERSIRGTFEELRTAEKAKTTKPTKQEIPLHNQPINPKTETLTLKTETAPDITQGRHHQQFRASA